MYDSCQHVIKIIQLRDASQKVSMHKKNHNYFKTATMTEFHKFAHIRLQIFEEIENIYFGY